MKRFLLSFSLLLFLFTFFIFSKAVHAQENKCVDQFEIKYDVNYQVFENGQTKVNQDVALKNKTDQCRATEYTFVVSLKDLKNIQASDSLGPITPKIETDNEKTQIKIIFNDTVIGKDKILFFKLSFETAQLATKTGLIWEVNIPGIEDKTKINEYNVSLSVPESFGQAAFIKPSKSFENKKLSWSKDEIPSGGILLAFGEFQVYKFDLTYHLKNPRLYPVQTEIAIPPQTAYQKIFLNEINPAPLNVKLDQDGNWLASYLLSPSSSLTVQVKGTAQVFLAPQNQEPLNLEIRKNYLTSQKYWETTDEGIQKLANSLKNPQDIYSFVVRELTYDSKKVEGNPERIGAAGILKNKASAICMEFTDLFIALSRAAGIPAREIDGFAYTKDASFRPLSLFKDALHAWPEFYDEQKQTWISVDPTWGKTTGGLDYFHVLDFDHLAFVVKGENSRYPVPAGGYKTNSNQNSKDVEVSFGQKEDLISKQTGELDLKIPAKIVPFFPITARVVFENKGNVLLPKHSLVVSTNELSPRVQQIEIADLPPGGKQETTINFAKTSLLTNKNVIIRLNDNHVSKEFNVLVSPFAILERRDFILGGVFLGAVFIIFFTKKARRLYLSRQIPPDSLRGQSQKSKSSSQ